MRIEDIDTPRVQPESEARILDDLRWLGLDWDEGPGCSGPAAPYHQSRRTALYAEAIELLDRRGRVYRCDCSRKEIVASAPHPGEEGPIYAGTCRHRGSGPFRRPPALRLLVPPDEPICFADAVHGTQCVDVAATAGDFVLRRGDGVFSYQLAVAVDDLCQGITQVVRGSDLLTSTARQLLIMRELGAVPPSYAHAPLVLGPDGDRLSKRARGVPIRDHREAGTNPERIIGYLACALGLTQSKEARAEDLIEGFEWRRVPRGPIVLDPSALGET